MNEKPAIGAGLAIGLLVIAIGMLVYFMSGGRSAGGGDAGDARRYYTIDDGKSYFPDDYSKIPPFEKDGKQAVAARVFRDLDTKDTFVAFLERRTPEARKMLEERRNSAAGGADIGPTENMSAGIEYKKPLTGDAGWIKSTDPRAQQLLDVRGPKGGQNVEEVFPE